MITKVSKSIQRAKSLSHVSLLKLFTVLYLLHKRIPNSNKCIQLCTKSRIKTNKLANRKKNKKKYLYATGLEPTSFYVLKTLDYPLGYRGIVINFIQISNCTNNLKRTFYEDSRRLTKRSLNIHMSRVNFDKQYNLMFYLTIVNKILRHCHSWLARP